MKQTSGLRFFFIFKECFSLFWNSFSLLSELKISIIYYVSQLFSYYFFPIFFHGTKNVCNILDEVILITLSISRIIIIKVSEYPFIQNKNMLKNTTVLLYRNFYNISLSVSFFNIYTLPFLYSKNIAKIRVTVGPKTDIFSYILSCCTNRIAVFNVFLTDM